MDRRITQGLCGDGGDIEFVDYKNGEVFVRMIGACAGCDLIDSTLQDGVATLLKEEVPGAKLILQVHDELLVECPDNPQTIEKTISIIKEKMENAVKLNVPLKVSIEYGKNWGEFH
mgnify:CR=1 FL=1